MSKNDGGYLLPAGLVEPLINSASSTSVIHKMYMAHRAPPKPPTLMQRLRGAVWRVRYRIANAIYPYPSYED